MKQYFLSAVMVAAFCLISNVGISEAPSSESLKSRIMTKANHGLIVAKIKAALMDRKDIHAKYIRVQHDGEFLRIAGFVRDSTQAEDVKSIVNKVGKDIPATFSWSYVEDLDNQEAYKTYVSEQAADAQICAKVSISLSAPDVKGLLEGKGEIQAIDVRQGKVRVFIIIDSVSDKIDLTPHVSPISGVKSVSQYILQAY